MQEYRNQKQDPCIFLTDLSRRSLPIGKMDQIPFLLDLRVPDTYYSPSMTHMPPVIITDSEKTTFS